MTNEREPSDAAYKAMCQAHSLCPIDLPYLGRMRWMAARVEAALASQAQPWDRAEHLILCYGSAVKDGRGADAGKCLEKLAAAWPQGRASQVVQEPVAYRFTHNRGNGRTAYTYHDNTPENNWRTAYRDTCLSIEPLYAAHLATGEPHTEVVPASSVQRLMGDLQKRSDECEGVLIHIHRDELRKLLAAASGVPASDEPERLEPHSPPGLHLASNFYGFLRRHAHSLKDPTRGAVEQAAELIDRQRLEIERLGRELEAATSGVALLREGQPE